MIRPIRDPEPPTTRDPGSPPTATPVSAATAATSATSATSPTSATSADSGAASANAGAPTPAPALRAARWTVLRHLRRAGPVSTAGLPARWPLTRHHLRMVVDGLVDDGLVARAPAGHARVPVLALTSAGVEALEGPSKTAPTDG